MKTVRHCFMGFAALLAMAAFLSPAGAVTQDINLTAIVPGSCTISGSGTPATAIQPLTVDGTGRVSTTTVTLSFPVSCNKPATVELTSVNSGLTGPTAISGFENKINYVATTSGLVPAVTIDTAISATATGLPSSGPITGTLAVAITPVANVNPLMAGAYDETLRLTVTPAQ
jgi:hypothetical protein